MLFKNSKSLLDAATKIVSESKAKFDQEQQVQEQARKEMWEAKLSPKQKKIAKLAGDPEKIDAADFAKLRKEDVEQVQELKASTLGKYIKAASTDAKFKGFQAGYNEGGEDARKKTYGGSSAGADLDTKAHKRLAGVKKATDKLTAKAMKEAAELDEARGRPRKNPLPSGSEDQGEEPDQNIVNHLKKSIDTGGSHDVKFADKSTHKVPAHVAKHVLNAMGKLKPSDRLEIQNHIGQSHSNLMQVHGMIK